MIERPLDQFIDECEEIALELRDELDLGDRERLDPRALAAHLAIDVYSIDRFSEELPNEVRQLTEEDVESFSAATVFCGTRCLILVNPAQADTEEALSIAHELAHRELEHEPTWPLFDENGNRRRWNPEEEAEAEYLAGAMMIPRSGIQPVLADFDGDPRRAAAHFGVGLQLLGHRLLASTRETPLWRLPSEPATSQAEAFAFLQRLKFRPI